MSDNVRRLKDKASRLYSSGRYKEALTVYEQILKEDPSELQCQIKIGDLHKRLGNKDKAVAAYLPVARHYATDGLLLKAIAVCKMVLSLDGEHDEGQALLSMLHAKRRSPAASGPPVTLRGMGIMPPPGGMVVAPSGGSFQMLELDENGLPSGLDLDTSSPAPQRHGVPSPSEQLWAGEENAWTNDLPGRLIDPDEDEASDEPDADIDVLPHVDTGAAPPAIGPQVVMGQPVVPVDGTDEPIELSPASAVKAAWPAAKPAAPGAPPPAWPTAQVDASNDIEEDLSAIQIPLFSELPRNAFIDLLVKMGMREVEPGDVIIKEGDVGDAFYVVASGKVRVSRRGTDGRDITLAYLTDTAFFGEMAVLQNGARTATVTAEESGHIFEIRREVLDEVIEKYPSVAKILRNFYRQRLLSTALSTHPVFTPFNPDERRGLMEMFKSRSVKAGDVLLEQGKKGSGLFILLHGQLEVVRLDVRGQAVTLAHLLAAICSARCRF